MKKVSDWSGEDVLHWLGNQGLQVYCDSLKDLNGRALLSLTQADFTTPPLSLVTSDGGKQLLERIETLRIENHIQAHKNGLTVVINGLNGHGKGLPTVSVDREANEINGFTNGSSIGGSNKHNPPRNGIRNGFVGNGFHHHSHYHQNSQYDSHKDGVQIQIPTLRLSDSTRSPFPEEWGKTCVALVYAVICFGSTTIMITIVHERVPPKEHTPPLPDKFFDLLERREWAFTICEINGMVLVVLWLLQWALLK